MLSIIKEIRKVALSLTLLNALHFDFHPDSDESIKSP
jgi:hypothetical protein